MRSTQVNSPREFVGVNASVMVSIDRLLVFVLASGIESGPPASSDSRFVPARFPADALAIKGPRWIPLRHSNPVATEPASNRRETDMEIAANGQASWRALALAGAAA
jgi:hypothetical protein